MKRMCALLAVLVACGSKPHNNDVDANIVYAADADPGDPVVSSFVFVGCNRLQKADLDPTNNPSSANLAELEQTFADIAALPEMPKYFFFTGDLVTALVSGSTTMQAQLDGWAEVWAASPLAGKIDLVPIVGNHEMLFKNNKGDEVSNPAADAVWIAWLAANHFDTHAGNGPTNNGPNEDALQDDQRLLTYSFDDGGAHYIALDTDSWTTTPASALNSTKVGWVPVHWLAADLAAAQANPATTGIYILGHKPLVAPAGADDGSLNDGLVVPIEQLVDSTPKVKGWFDSHVHLWQATQLPGNRGVWQIIAGNGGSQLEASWTEPAPYFGFTVVKTYASGKVGVVSYKRLAPLPYNAQNPLPAVASPEITIGQS